MWDKQYLDELNTKRAMAIRGGGPGKVEKQHNRGKLTARERLDYLFDKDTFVEVNTLVESQSTLFDMPDKKVPGDGVVIGYGNINGRPVFASSQDFTVIGGTLGEYHSKKICHIMDMAYSMRCPYISINDSGGARIEEGISSLDGYSGVFYCNTRASGVIPQISVMMGPCAGGACYSPAISDFIFMTQKAHMFITGPSVVDAVIGEQITADELGGAQIHTELSGVAHFSYDNDYACLDGVKKLLSYLPSNCEEKAPHIDTKNNDKSKLLQNIVPDNQKQIYDMQEVINAIIDDNSFFEIQAGFARNVIIGLSRIDGNVIGIVANNPKGGLVGSLDINASIKAARFVRFCDSFNIPLLTLVDVPGFFPGKNQEHNGIIRHGAKLLYAYAEATVPKVTLILRKAFGGAYIAMNSKGLGADIVYAWPIAQTAVLGAESAVAIMYKKRLENSSNPDAERKELIQQYEKEHMTPYLAAQKGYIDEVIFPEETRKKIQSAFFTLKNKHLVENSIKKHGNLPM